MTNVSVANRRITKRRLPVLIGIGVFITNCVGYMSVEAADPPGIEIELHVGTIEGVVTYESDRKRPWRYRRYYVADREKGHLAEAVVSLADPPRGAHPAEEEPRSWTIDQKDYRFIPETIAVRSGDQIKFANSDPLLHDVTTRQREGSAGAALQQSSFSLRQRQHVTQVFRDAGGAEHPVTLSCRLHSAMRGWIYVFDHPFFQVTGQEGTFRLEDVPAGERRFVMVHPAGNLRWEGMIDVKAGQTHRIEVRVSPDDVLLTEE